MDAINPTDNPELFDEESRAGLLFVVLPILMGLAATTVGLRFYTRAVILGLIGLDDWLCLASMGTIFAFGGLALALVTRGLGRHIGTLPQPNGFRDYMKLFYVMIIFYNLAIASFKLCFLAQYYRIIHDKTMRRLLFAATGFVAVWTMSQIGLNIFQCSPISGFWEPGPGVTCLSVVPGWFVAAAGNIIADIIIILLPLPTIKGLNLPRAQKLALAGIFCLGFLTTAISLVRLKYLPQGRDITWDNTDTTFWSMAEACTGIICVTLPTLKPLAVRWFPRVFLALSRSTGGSSGRPTGGSRHWQPKDLESGADEGGCGLRSVARRATKQWSTIGDQDDTQATRTNVTTSDDRRQRQRSSSVPQRQQNDQNRRRSHSHSHGHGPKASWSQTRSHTRSQTRKSSTTTTTFLDAASEEGVDIELDDVGTRSRDRDAATRGSYPTAAYQGGDGGGVRSGAGATVMRTGHAVDISAGRASPEAQEDPYIRLHHEVDIKGLAR